MNKIQKININYDNNNLINNINYNNINHGSDFVLQQTSSDNNTNYEIDKFSKLNGF
jgi:hypothetical protein